MRIVEWRTTAWALSIVAVLSYGIAVALHTEFYVVFLALVAGLVLNAVAIEVEDQLPGGYLNPDGSKTPRWLAPASRGTKLLGILMLMGVATLLAFTGDIHSTRQLVVRCLFAATPALLAVALALKGGRRRVATWLAVFSMVCSLGYAYLGPA